MYVSEKTTQHRAHAVCMSSLQSQRLLFQFDEIRSKQVTTKSPMNHRGSPAHKNTSQRHRPQLAGKTPNCSSHRKHCQHPDRQEIGHHRMRGWRRWRVELRYHSCAWSYWHRMADCTQSKVQLQSDQVSNCWCYCWSLPPCGNAWTWPLPWLHLVWNPGARPINENRIRTSWIEPCLWQLQESHEVPPRKRNKICLDT